MSFELIGLGRLLQTIYSSNAKRTSILRADLRAERKKAAGFRGGSGGDFYVPFWADVKRHVSGGADLRDMAVVRIASSKGRDRLYTMLRDNFLLWWEEKRRLRNVPFRVIDENVKARYEVAGYGTVKVENTLSITVGDDGHRIFYPYFCEDPALSEEAARLGLWLMSQCIKDYTLKDMRLLDVIRGRSFSEHDTPLLGGEEDLFRTRYAEVLKEWHDLRPGYGL